MTYSEDGQSAALRAKNQATVEKYLKTPGISRLELFTVDAVKTLPFATHPSHYSPDNETPISWKGKEALRENFQHSVDNFNGKWATPKIYSTQDPNKFWVETALESTFLVDGKKIPYNQPYYVMSFDMEDGLICKFQEIMNPLQVIKCFGCEDPAALLERNKPEE